MGDDEERKPRVIGKVIRGGSSAEIHPVAPSAPPPNAPPAPPKRPAVVSAGDYEAGEKAKQIVADAQREAARIIEAANIEKEALFAKTADDARAEVMAQASEELARTKMQAGQLLANMEGRDRRPRAEDRREDHRPRPRSATLRSSLDIVATAIDNVRGAKAMVLRVNPRNAALLRAAKKAPS